ncbi:hypothetical protein L7F22_034581 [Adiantum nelumboides]|nr:hypothetical protein [Adiantum nelumboides]
MARGCLLLVWSGALFIFPALILCKAVPRPRERTLAMVKPDGVRANHTDAIKSIIELAGFDIIKQKSLQLDRMTAQVFYYEHFGKPFFEDLINFMTRFRLLYLAWSFIVLNTHASF